jgi:acetyl-CoA C-acetyltransferase
MGIGPVAATQILLQKTSLSKEAIRLIEINEAFAAQVLAVQRELQFPEDKLNANGGAIAIGHPLGASGARLCVHLVHRLNQLGGGYGIGTACIGGGQGMAVLLKVG